MDVDCRTCDQCVLMFPYFLRWVAAPNLEVEHFPDLMDIVRVLLSWAAGVHSEEKSCQCIPTCTQHRHTHTQNTSISCIHDWRHHARRHRCTLNVHVLLILKGFPDFDETCVCVVSIWNSISLGATGKSPRCFFFTISPTPHRDGNHSQRLLPRISSIFKLTLMC